MNMIGRLTDDGKFSKTQKRIAGYICANVEEVCFMSLKHLAKEADVTEATIINFCHKLGYKSFLDLKRNVQEYVKRRVSPTEKIENSIIKYKNEINVYEKMVGMEKKCLDSTYRYMDVENMMKFAESINSAGRIYIIGHHISEVIADFLGIRLQQIGISAFVVDPERIQEAVNRTLQADDGDVFVVISLPSYSKSVIKIVKYLHANEKKILGITDSISSPIAYAADYLLLCSTEHPVFYNSITSVISLVDILASIIATKRREQYSGYRKKYDKTFGEISGGQ